MYLKEIRHEGCDFIGKSELYLKLHIRRKHVKAEAKADPASCEICEKDFKDNIALKKHVKRVHLAEKHLQCKLCEKSFKTKLRSILSNVFGS